MTSIAFTGDIAFSKYFAKGYENPNLMDGEIVDFLQTADHVVANVEAPVTGGDIQSERKLNHVNPPEAVPLLLHLNARIWNLANNHTMDHGKTGFQATKDALDAAEVTYVEPDGSALYTTESGLTIGLYAVNFALDKKDMKQEITALRKAGAEIVVVAFHWGIEGSYRANPEQIQNAHDCIDAGADIVYGHHPHVLQRIEEYNGGIIYYSLGNFSFGGNTFPRDTDSVILRQEIIREVDGSVRVGEMELIPVSISSMVGQNNYQPIPLEPGTEAYDRVLSKLDGSFTGPDLNVDYSDIQEPTEEPTEDAGGDATQPPADVPTDPPSEPPVETPTEAPTEAPTQPPADPPAESPTPDGET